jgi:hypothetical protein
VINKFSHIGAYHDSIHEENQDVVYSGTNRRFSVISLADGVSSEKEARAGAEIASEAVTNLFLYKGDCFMDFETEKIAEFTASHVLYELNQKAAADSKAVEDYSSTIASVVYDKRKRKLLLLNLGDSMIIAASNGKCFILAMPSDSLNGCCVTTTKKAALMTKVKVMDVGVLDSILICSDGAWKNMIIKNRLKPEVASLIACGEYRKFKDYLESQESFDDYSFISMDLKHNHRRKSA